MSDASWERAKRKKAERDCNRRLGFVDGSTTQTNLEAYVSGFHARGITDRDIFAAYIGNEFYPNGIPEAQVRIEAFAPTFWFA